MPCEYEQYMNDRATDVAECRECGHDEFKEVAENRCPESDIGQVLLKCKDCGNQFWRDE